MNKHIKSVIDNFEILKGSYFNELFEITENLRGLNSYLFKDIGWNYVFCPKSKASINLNEIDEIAKYYKDVEPFFVYSTSQNLTIDNKSITTLGDFSVWMSCSPKLLTPIEHDFKIETICKPSKNIIDQLVSLFSKSYCNGLEGHIGYNDLGDYYPAGYKKMLETSSRITNFVIYYDNNPAGIATIAFDETKTKSGLYNVAILPEFRKLGLGKIISYEAVNHAFKEGYRNCILQTESHTKVEDLYKSIGFSVDFHMQYTNFKNV